MVSPLSDSRPWSLCSVGRNVLLAMERGRAKYKKMPETGAGTRDKTGRWFRWVEDKAVNWSSAKTETGFGRT